MTSNRAGSETAASNIPRATARLQIHAGFTLLDALQQVEYFSALGISHLYVSPLFTARPGSTHGYDVTDFDSIDPAIGGEAALRALVAQLRDRQMGLIIDIVPNHMAASINHNHWWRDVLMAGRHSPYANYFDIDWAVRDPSLHHKILLPVLADPYGATLASGLITLHFEADLNRFELHYFDQRLPLTPTSYPSILRSDPQHRFETWAGQLEGDLPDHTSVPVDTPLVLPRDVARSHLSSLKEHYAPDSLLGRANLHALIQQQHYRLAWWRSAADELNWRRFFEISELVGLRVEREEVFEATHSLILRLYEEALIDGVRVDHVDGLADPAAYLRRLRLRLEACGTRRPDANLRATPYIVVEKILAADETLRPEWGVNGTTGYDFMNEASAVLHDADGAAQLNTVWFAVSGSNQDFPVYEYQARQQILSEHLCSERDSLLDYLHQLAAWSADTQDLTRVMLGRALDAMLLHFPVYRTYLSAQPVSRLDEACLEFVLARARVSLRQVDHPVLLTIAGWLAGPPLAPDAAEALRLHAIARFQQLSSPLAAKSVEDTAFYRYGRLLSRNEVGSKPDQLALSVAQFHHCVLRRAHHFPHAMLALATHDHKRGADARARLAVLSEQPVAWQRALHAWRGALTDAGLANSPPTPPTGASQDISPAKAPHMDPIDQAMLLQTLVGAWPLTLPAMPGSADRLAVSDLIERVVAWQSKALREAKCRSNWIEPDQAYEHLCESAVRGLIVHLGQARSPLAEIGRLVHDIAALGALNSLAQVTLHLTTPGVPDLYQGTERWDFSLVDPDNRRPVDYPLRNAGLTDSADWPALQQSWHDGSIKQRVIQALLVCRRNYPTLFAMGDYQPLALAGVHAGRALAFVRNHGKARLLVVVSRCVAPLMCPEAPLRPGPLNSNTPPRVGLPLVPASRWQDTVVLTPASVNDETTSVTHWHDVLTGRAHSDTEGGLLLSELLHDLPVAVLYANKA